MQLLALPVELFELILRDAILTRGLKRGLRLRLVNKAFAKAAMDALYTFKLLEQLLKPIPDGYRPDNGPREIPLSLRGSYLAHRVLDEPLNGNPILVRIRQAAVEIHKSDDPGMIKLPTFDAYVKLLCSSMDSYYTPTDIEGRYEKWPYYTRYSPTARFIEVFRKGDPGDVVTDIPFESYLYAAAIRTNCVSLIQDCINRDPRLLDTTSRCRRGTNLILGDCFILAAQYASTTVLEYFLTAGTKTVNSDFRHFVFVEAAQAGRLDMASFLYHFMLDEVSWDFLPSDYYQRRGTMWLRGTSDLDMIKFAATLSPDPNPPLKEYALVYALQEAAAAGRLETVMYLVQHNVPATGLIVFEYKYGFNYTDEYMWKEWSRIHKSRSHPVRIAAEEGHAPIVSFLLRHGASAAVAMCSAAKRGQGHVVQTLLNTYPASEDALLKSVMGGYTTIARMLLEKGADANGGLEERVALAEGSTVKEKSPLVYAIEKENTTLVKLLIRHGASFGLLGTAEECAKQAKDNGLESMLVLLEYFGI